ncbi:MAG: alpha/beta hydrolase [Variibacter sp.]|nr:alpha/beta hydrolase [Variibacter sp.]
MRFRVSVMLAAIVGAALAGPALGQIAPPRSIEELKAETQARADRNAYPLTGLKPAEVREALARIHSLDRDEWAAAWSVIAERYVAKAKSAEDGGRRTEASEDYLQAWRYYSFARWPTPNSPGKRKAYLAALEAFRNHARFLEPAPEVVRIPFEGKEIVGYLRLPNGARGAPLVLRISALDSRKEEAIEASDVYLRRGIGVFALDMPGTGEAPLKIDVGAERMFSRAIDYLLTRPEIDGKRIAVQGGSWSGHWAAKLAVAERARLKAVVAQGAPVHHYFQKEWQQKALGTREYLFDLFAARASVYGVETLEEFYAYGPRLSMLNGDLVKKPTAPMLLVNGDRDTQVPIADLDLLLHSGSAKEAWVNPEGGHMGRSKEWPDGRIFREVVAPWIARHLAAE